MSTIEDLDGGGINDVEVIIDDNEQSANYNDIEIEVGDDGAQASAGMRVERVHYDKSLRRIFREIFDSELFNTLTMDDLIIRQERLMEYFQKFEQVDLAYRQLDQSITDFLFITLEGDYMTAMSKIRKKLAENNSRDQSRLSSTTISNEVNNQPTEPTVIRVEQARDPQCGEFNGNEADWPAFRDLFMAEVHNKSYDPVTKLLYLNKACVGNAKKTLGSWKPVAENYEIAWNVLKEKYEDNYLVIQGLIGQMFGLKNYEKENYESLNTVYEVVNHAMRQLGNVIASDTVILEQVLIFLSCQRLANQTLDSWENHRSSGNAAIPTLKEFHTFLMTKARGRKHVEGVPEPFDQSKERGHHSRREHNNSRFQPYSRSDRFHFNRNDNRNDNRNRNPFRGQNNTRVVSEPSRSKCYVGNCKESHPLFMCTEFRKLNVNGRIEIANVNRLCRCCLSTGHNAISCSRDQYKCKRCTENSNKHHYLLCPKAMMNSHSSNQNPATQ